MFEFILKKFLNCEESENSKIIAHYKSCGIQQKDIEILIQDILKNSFKNFDMNKIISINNFK